MKRIWITCGLCLFLHSLPAQQLRDIQFGADIYPQMIGQIFDDPDLGKASYQLGASLGGHVYWNAEGKLGVKAGLRFSQVRIDQIDYSIIFACDLLISTGSGIMNSWVRSTQTLYYFGIPLELHLQLSEGPQRWYAKAGGEMRLHLGGNEQSMLYECNVDTGLSPETLTPEPASALALVSLGLGYEFPAAKGSHLFIEPTVDYAFLDLFKAQRIASFFTDRLNNSRLLSFGLVLGIRF